MLEFLYLIERVNVPFGGMENTINTGERMYYLLEKNIFQEPRPYMTECLTDVYSLRPSAWIKGSEMKMPTESIRIELVARAGNGLSEIYLDSIPLFRKDLLAALEDAGVNNLQSCPATLITPEGDAIAGFNAVNIVGKIACADMIKSEYDDITGTGLIAVGFRKLVIDEKKAQGKLFFRLAEAVASIIVHEKVKRAIDQLDFRYLSWRALSD